MHNTLAEGMRELGHEVTVASNGDFWKDYPRDINLARRTGKIGGIALLAKVYSQLHQWRDFDVVQLINPMFLELKAERIFPIYRRLRKQNKKMVLCAMGMDYYWVHECTYNKPLRYSDFNIGDQVRTDEPAQREQQDWLGTSKERLNKLIANDCDAIVAGLYDDYVCYKPHFPQKLHFIPLPIHTTGTTPLDNPSATEKLRLFVGISKGRSAYKGTDIMIQAAEALMKRYPDRLEIIKAEGVPFNVYQHLMDTSDAMMDQLYSYTPAMNALLAMSKGIVVIGGGEPENYDILGEDELRPIINVQPSYDSVCQQVEQLILHLDRLSDLKRQSIAYVHRHHNYLAVAQKYIDLYQRL